MKDNPPGVSTAKCTSEHLSDIAARARKKPKKRKMDKPSGSDEDENDCESVSSVETDETVQDIDDMDQGQPNDENEAGFKLVSHRKKRPTGVPVLLQPAPGRRLQELNPLTLSKAVCDTMGESPVRHRFTSRGGLLIDVKSEDAVNKLLKCKALCEVNIKPTIPSAYTKNTGIIKGVPKWHTDADILEFLAGQGVIFARRIRYRGRDADEQVLRDTDKVVLTFKPNSERPTKINLGFTRHEVEEYIETPPRCYKCQRPGHVAKYCQNEERCKRCSGPHDIKQCRPENSQKCANCGLPQVASHLGCKARSLAMRNTKTFVYGRKERIQSNAEATSSVRAPPLTTEDNTNDWPRLESVAPRDQGATASNAQPAHRSSAHQKYPAAKNTSNSRQNSEKGLDPPLTVSSVGNHPTNLPKTENGNSAATVIAVVFATLRTIVESMPASPNREALRALLALEPILVQNLQSGSSRTHD